MECTTSRPVCTHEKPEQTYLFDSGNSELLVDFRPDTLDLDTNVSALLDGLIIVVGPMRWCRVCIEFNLGRDHLPVFSARKLIKDPWLHTARLTKHSSEPTLTKKPERTTEVTLPST